MRRQGEQPRAERNLYPPSVQNYLAFENVLRSFPDFPRVAITDRLIAAFNSSFLVAFMTIHILNQNLSQFFSYSNISRFSNSPLPVLPIVLLGMVAAYQIKSQTPEFFYNSPHRFAINHLKNILKNAAVCSGFMAFALNQSNIPSEIKLGLTLIATLVGAWLGYKDFVNKSIPLAYHVEALDNEEIVRQSANIHQTPIQKIRTEILSNAAGAYFYALFCQSIYRITTYQEMSNWNLLASGCQGSLLSWGTNLLCNRFELFKYQSAIFNYALYFLTLENLNHYLDLNYRNSPKQWDNPYNLIGATIALIYFLIPAVFEGLRAIRTSTFNDQALYFQARRNVNDVEMQAHHQPLLQA